MAFFRRPRHKNDDMARPATEEFRKIEMFFLNLFLESGVLGAMMVHLVPRTKYLWILWVVELWAGPKRMFMFVGIQTLGTFQRFIYTEDSFNNWGVLPFPTKSQRGDVICAI